MSATPETHVRKCLAIKENRLRGSGGGKGNPQEARSQWWKWLQCKEEKGILTV